jgi:hypothetical protein
MHLSPCSVFPSHFYYRQISESGVAHVMRVFLRNFAASHSSSEGEEDAEKAQESDMEKIADAECDEILLSS